jgi:hypothetical protein
VVGEFPFKDEEVVEAGRIDEVSSASGVLEGVVDGLEVEFISFAKSIGSLDNVEFRDECVFVVLLERWDNEHLNPSPR